MRHVEALSRLKVLDLSPFGIKSLELFGSTARDQARPDSDVDLLVDFEGPVTFDRYTALWDYLEDALGTRVDLVLRRSLRPEIRPHVESEGIRVA
jgi:predicted nucleotidyltransferase